MQNIIFINENQNKNNTLFAFRWATNEIEITVCSHFRWVFLWVLRMHYYTETTKNKNVQIEVVSWTHVETKRFLLNIIRCIFDISSVQPIWIVWIAADKHSNKQTNIYIDEIRKTIRIIGQKTTSTLRTEIKPTQPTWTKSGDARMGNIWQTTTKITSKPQPIY